MLPNRKKYDREEIERLLAAQAERLGIAPERLDAQTEGADSLRTLLCELLEETLNAAAEAESAELRRRQKEGLDRAQANGVTFGRPRKLSDRRFRQMLARYERHEVTAAEAAEELGVSESTFYRRLRQSRE